MFHRSKTRLRRVLAMSNITCRRMGPKAGRGPAIGLGIMVVLSGGCPMGQPALPAVRSEVHRPNTVVVTNYHGWTNALSR